MDESDHQPEHPNPVNPANPKTRGRGLSRTWPYKQLAHLHQDGPDIFDAADLATSVYGARGDSFDVLRKVAAGEISLPAKLPAVAVAHTLRRRLEFLHYQAESIPEAVTPKPLRERVAVAELRQAIEEAAVRHNGATSFNTHLAEKSGLPVHKIRRIRRAQKTITLWEADQLLHALDQQHRYHELSESYDTEQKARQQQAERLEEALRPILRMLASHAERDGLTPAENQGIDDWLSMHAAERDVTVIPYFTSPARRNAILRAHFIKEHKRPPEEIPDALKKQALRVLRAQRDEAQKAYRRAAEQIGLKKHEQIRADGDEQALDQRLSDLFNPARIGELNRGARKAGYLPAKSRRRGHK